MFWGLEFGLALVAVLLIWWWVARHMPKGIVRRLQRSGAVKVRFVLPPNGLWNPALPGNTVYAWHGSIYDPGHALYSLNDEGRVELRFWPKSGPVRHFVGPTPEELLRPTQSQSMHRKLTIRLLSAYGFTLLVGFTVGFFVAHGSLGSRCVAGALGAIIAWMILRFGLIVFVAVKANRVRPEDTT
jgi:hypothetical protein